MTWWINTDRNDLIGLDTNIPRVIQGYKRWEIERGSRTSPNMEVTL
jgi:hypothetical protein